jgi:WD40 repeat protein
VASLWNGYLTVAVSPDGRIAAAANRYVIVLFDLVERRQVGWFWALDSRGKSFRLPRPGIGDTLEFIDQHHVVTTGMGGLATIWDIRNGQETARLAAPLAGTYGNSLAFAPTSGDLAIGMRDGAILVSRIEGMAFTEPAPLLSHVDRVNDIAFSADGRFMASAGHDKSVLIWDMETRLEIGRLATTGDISDLELVASEQSLIVAGDDVAVWKFLAGEEAQALAEHKAIGQWMGTGALYALQAGLLLTGLGGGIAAHDPQNCGRFVTVSPDGRLLVDVKPSPLANKVTVLDMETNVILHEVDVKNAICDVEFTADGSRLVLVGDGGLFLVDVATWTLMDMHMIVDGFRHAPRVVLAEPGDAMGLAVTGHQAAAASLPKAGAEEPRDPNPPPVEQDGEKP